MSNPTVFISYSHDSDDHRDKVLALSERLRADGIATRLDQYLNGAPAEGWPRWMRKQLIDADFVLVICTATYYRRFWGEEEPGKGKGADWEGALITQEIYDERSATLKFVPIIFAPDQQAFIPESLRSKNHYLLNSEANYQTLYDFLLGQAGVEAGDIGELKRKPRRKREPLRFAGESSNDPQHPISNPQFISTSRLPQLLTPDLFGRDKELQLLDDAWANSRTNVVSFVAWGGVGKTALVHHWLQALEQDHWRGAERVFAWSFYSQGTSDRSATAEFFINAALRWFGGDQLADKLQTAGQWEKGERLAQLIRQTRTLLILDGLEPVQHPPLQADAPEGGLKEQSMQALLRELAAHQPGLCVISTRFAITDLTQFEGRTVIRHPLDELAPQAGAELLRRLKVNRTQEELEAAAQEYGGHSLALTLLGSYLSDVYAGDVRRRHGIESLEGDRKHGHHARKMLRAYEKWLSETGQSAMLDVLRMLGLFDRPADGAAIAALRAEPVIAGLTDTLSSLDERQWRQTLAALRDLRLLAEAAPHDPGALDAHPLVREHFREQLQRHYPDSWRAANLRLYEHLTATTKDLPATVEEMAPLFAAVAHGCAAGRHQEALDDVFLRRIQRGYSPFSIDKLGAFGSNLAALVGFFATP
jgi:hypothetical protein